MVANRWWKAVVGGVRHSVSSRCARRKPVVPNRWAASPRITAPEATEAPCHRVKGDSRSALSIPPGKRLDHSTPMPPSCTRTTNDEIVLPFTSISSGASRANAIFVRINAPLKLISTKCAWTKWPLRHRNRTGISTAIRIPHRCSMFGSLQQEPWARSWQHTASISIRGIPAHRAKAANGLPIPLTGRPNAVMASTVMSAK